MWCYLTAVRAPVWDALSLLSQALSWFLSGFVPAAHPCFLHPSSPTVPLCWQCCPPGELFHVLPRIPYREMYVVPC